MFCVFNPLLFVSEIHPACTVNAPHHANRIMQTAFACTYVRVLVYTTRRCGDESISRNLPPSLLPQNALQSLSSPWLEDSSVGNKSVAFPVQF